MGFQVRHSEFGIYQGSAIGMGFWYPMSEMPEQGFVEFDTEQDSQSYIDFLCSDNCASPLRRQDLSVEPFDFVLSEQLIAQSENSGHEGGS